MKKKFQAGGWLKWLIALWIFGGVVAAEGEGAGEDEMRELQAELEELQKKVEAADLEDGIKQGNEEVLKKVGDRLEEARGFQQQIEAMGSPEPVAPEEIAQLEQSLKNLPTAEELLGEMPVEVPALRVRLDSERAELENVTTQLDEKDRQLARLKELPVKVGARLPQANSELEQQKALLAARGEPSAESLKGSAERLRIKVEIEALELETRLLSNERVGHASREKVASLEREILRERQSRLKEAVHLIENRINERLRSVVDRLREDVEALVEGAPSGPLSELAGELPGLVDQLSKATEALESTADHAEVTSRQLENLQRESLRLRQQSEIGGQEGAFSQVFLDRRRRLADPRGLEFESRATEQELSDAQIAGFQLEDLQEDQARLVKRWGEKPEAKPILDMREELLGRLVNNQRALIQDLARLNSDKRAYQNLTRDFGRFLSEQLFLSRSSKPIGPQFFSDLPSSAGWVFSVDHLSQLGPALRAIPSRHPFFFGLLVLAVGGLVALRGKLRASIQNSGRRIRRISTDRMAHTLRALFETLLLALPLPMVLAFLAWAIANQAWADTWVRGLGSWLGWSAYALMWIFSMRELARPGGVGREHFGWDGDSSEVLRRVLGFITVLYLPTLLVAGLTVYDSNASHFDSVGRLSFMVAQGVLAVAFWKMFHPGSGVFAEIIRERPDRLLSKGRYLWLALPAGVPVVLLVMAAVGYSLTAMILSEVFHACLRWVAVAVVVYGLLFRWFSIQGRRIALQERLEAWEARRSEEEEDDDHGEQVVVSEEELAEMDLEAVAQQTRRLLRSLVGIGALVAMVYTTTAMLPLEKVSEAETAAGFGWLGLLRAILIGAVGLTVVRNLPGLLDLAGMRESGVSPGIRYAVATLCQYAVGALALFLITQALAVDWSKFGWIAAALSVGLGFGLQEIVANFVCGIIILFERPIRVGDVVTVGEVTGTVSRIRMRATTITNWERQEFVVPNKDFITGSLINWTLSNPINRITLQIGVAYGSDTQEARRIMTEVAEAHPAVMEDPGPLVNFETFGDSTLNLSMRCYLPTMDNRLRTVTELNEEIDRRFKEAGIEIAFPQQDLHIRSMPDPADLYPPLPGTEKEGK
ncbi:MAG: mechanosensitive ion channel domain-containing protein [Haloferula sp.]